MDTVTPELTAIIVSWNRCADLRVLLESLGRQDYPNLRVVVVDNGSTDGTEQMLSTWPTPLTYYACPRNEGAAAARNIGLALSRDTEYVAFLDSDAELLAPDTLTALVRHLEDNPAVVAVAPAIYKDSACTELWLIGAYADKDYYLDYGRCLTDSANPDFLSTCVSVWRARPVCDSGGFDPAYPFGFEDFDLCDRIRRKTGMEFEVVPAIKAVHHLSDEGRPRTYDTWQHQLYVEVVTQRHRVLTWGFWGYLRASMRQGFTPGGRRMLRRLHGGFAFGFWRESYLWYCVPVLSLLRLQRYRRETAASAWIDHVALREDRLHHIS